MPHLILQPLVENAVKHGIAPFAGKGRIEIRSRKIKETLVLEVKNDSAKKSAEAVQTNENSGGTGLKNVRSRLERIYGADFRFELAANADGGTSAVLEIPFAAETQAILLN